MRKQMLSLNWLFFSFQIFREDKFSKNAKIGIFEKFCWPWNRCIKNSTEKCQKSGRDITLTGLWKRILDLKKFLFDHFQRRVYVESLFCLYLFWHKIGRWILQKSLLEMMLLDKSGKISSRRFFLKSSTEQKLKVIVSQF